MGPAWLRLLRRRDAPQRTHVASGRSFSGIVTSVQQSAPGATVNSRHIASIDFLVRAARRRAAARHPSPGQRYRGGVCVCGRRRVAPVPARVERSCGRVCSGGVEDQLRQARRPATPAPARRRLRFCPAQRRPAQRRSPERCRLLNLRRPSGAGHRFAHAFTLLAGKIALRPGPRRRQRRRYGLLLLSLFTLREEPVQSIPELLGKVSRGDQTY